LSLFKYQVHPLSVFSRSSRGSSKAPSTIKSSMTSSRSGCSKGSAASTITYLSS
jgi:hypothetical protein